MVYEDLKCEFCDGHGEREINVDGADCPQTCSFCDGTGIDQDQLMKLPKVVKMLEALKALNEERGFLGERFTKQFLEDLQQTIKECEL